MTKQRSVVYIVLGVVAAVVLISQWDLLAGYTVKFNFLPSGWKISAQLFFAAAAVGFFVAGVIGLLRPERQPAIAGMPTSGAAPTTRKGSKKTAAKSAAVNVKPSPANTPAKSWAIAAAGNLIQRNKDSFDALNSNVPNPRKLLIDWWGVHDAKELEGILTWLETEGHRKSFKALSSAIANLPPEGIAQFAQRLPPDKAPVVQFVWDNRQKFTGGDLLAWDLARLINVVRFGYAAGYIDEQAAWTKVIAAAQQLQQCYHSWQDLGENYSLGWQFWQNGKALAPQEAEAVQWLLTNADSPWTRIAWNTPLTA